VHNITNQSSLVNNQHFKGVARGVVGRETRHELARNEAEPSSGLMPVADGFSPAIGGRLSRYNPVTEAWADWLTQHDKHDLFSWYCHFTFRPGQSRRGNIHPEKAEKLFNTFRHRLNQDIFGRNYERRKLDGVLIARATEYGQKSDFLHYHAIIGRVPDRVRRLDYKDEWDGLAGFARIYPYDKSQGGAMYLSKSAYAWKRGEIDLIGPWQHLNAILNGSYNLPMNFTTEGNPAIN